jgi:hypothetical protein
MLRRLGPPLLAVLCPLLSGCYSKATAYEGKFTFAYSAGSQIENFVKPIAPGAKLDIVAFSNGTEDKLVVTKATSSKSSVVAVDAVARQTVTLKGGAPGVAEIEVTARDPAGNVLVDKMFFHVARPARHALEHSCTEAPEAVWVRGEDIHVFHGLATADGRAVVGYGYAPVQIEPAGALELVAQPQGADLYRFRAAGSVGNATIRSTVDGKAIALRIVERKELTDVSLLASERLVEGRSEYIVARVRSGEAPVCSQNALTRARSLTPEICKVSAKLDDELGDSNHEQLALVTALKFGECEYEMTLPELAGGKGVVLKGRAKVGRLQYPGEGTAGSPAPAAGACRVLGWDGRTWASTATCWIITRFVVLVGALVWLRSRRTAPLMCSRPRSTERNAPPPPPG